MSQLDSADLQIRFFVFKYKNLFTEWVTFYMIKPKKKQSKKVGKEFLSLFRGAKSATNVLQINKVHERSQV